MMSYIHTREAAKQFSAFWGKDERAPIVFDVTELSPLQPLYCRIVTDNTGHKLVAVEFNALLKQGQELPAKLTATLDRLSGADGISVHKNGLIKHETIPKEALRDHLYPHGNIPNGTSITIRIDAGQLRPFAEAAKQALAPKGPH